MLARVAGLRIPDEKPSGSCTYPGCTCMPRRVGPRRELARCFKHLSRGVFLTSRMSTNSRDTPGIHFALRTGALFF